jgi:hypothetical protein
MPSWFHNLKRHQVLITSISDHWISFLSFHGIDALPITYINFPIANSCRMSGNIQIVVRSSFVLPITIFIF